MAVEPPSDTDRMLRSFQRDPDDIIIIEPDPDPLDQTVIAQENRGLVPAAEEEITFEEVERLLDRGMERARERIRQNELLRRT